MTHSTGQRIDTWWKGLPEEDQAAVRRDPEQLPQHLVTSLANIGVPPVAAYFTSVGGPDGFPLPPDVREYLEELDEADA